MSGRLFFRIILIATLSLQVWFLYIIFNHPMAGFSVKQNEQGEWRVGTNYSTEFAQNMKVLPGDLVIEVNGKPTDEYINIKRWRSLFRFDEIVLERDGVQFAVHSGPVSFSILNFDSVQIVGQVVSFIAALLLHYRLKSSKSGQLLALVFYSIGVIFMSMGASARGDVLGKFFVGSFVIILPFVFLHFLIQLINEKAKMNISIRFTRYIYMFVTFLFVVELASYIPTTGYTYYVYQFMVAAALLLLMGGILGNVVFLGYIYFKYRQLNSYLNTIIKFIWGTLFVSFSPIIFLALLPYLLTQQYLFNQAPLPILYVASSSVLILPISFAYLILSKRIYDIDMVIRRIMFTALLSCVPAIMLTLLIIMVVSKITWGEMGWIFVTALLGIGIMIYLLEYLMLKLQPLMFPRKHAMTESLTKISQSLRDLSSFTELKETFLIDIVHTLQLRGGAIAFCSEHRNEIIPHGELDTARVEQLIEDGMTEHKEYQFYEINHNEEYTSILIITGNRHGIPLRQEEIQWLRLIISYLSVSLDNLYLIGKLQGRLQDLANQMEKGQELQERMWFKRMIFDMQEEERQRIAVDIQETTMQDLQYLKLRFQKLFEKYASDKASIKQLADIEREVETINTSLRQSCFELYPFLLKESGLVATIDKVVEQERSMAGYEVAFTVDNKLKIETQELDVKRHLFRIVQELLNNARKHSKASKIKLHLCIINGQIMLHYEDNGVGIAKQQKQDDRNAQLSGMGTEYMKSRIQMLGGDIRVDDGAKHGIICQIQIPLSSRQTAS